MAHWVDTYPHTVYASVLLKNGKIINWKVGERKWTDIFSMTRRIRRDRPFNLDDYASETVESKGWEVNNDKEHNEVFEILALEWFKQWPIHEEHEGDPAYREPLNYWNEARKYLPSSNCLKRKYACVLVNERGEIVSIGYNHSKTSCKKCARENIPSNTGNYAECRSIHSEQMALLSAGLGHNMYNFSGLTMYLVCDRDDDPQPCPICQRLLDWCGVVIRREKDE